MCVATINVLTPMSNKRIIDIFFLENVIIKVKCFIFVHSLKKNELGSLLTSSLLKIMF